jgi:putative peptide zinc metalloprotease protein
MPDFPKLRKDLVSSRSTSDETVYHTIKDPVTGRYFRLREPEFWLINQLDGDTSPEEISQRFKAKFDLSITPDQVREFVTALEKLFFLEDTRAEQEISRAGRQIARGRSLFGRLLYVRLKAFRPGRTLDFLARLYRPFHSRFWSGVAALIVIAALVILVENSAAFVRPYSLAMIFTLGSIAAIVVSLFILIVVHEYAHAVMCRYYGGEVSEMGFLLMYFQPCFYCNVSDAWLFPRKSHRMLVTLAGPLFQLLLTALAVFVWRVTVPGTFISEVARITVTVSVITYLFNFNPLIKLDGYYLLADWLEIPNLRSRAFGYLGNVAKRRLLGWPIERVEVTRRERKIFLVYAILALSYSGFLIGWVLFIVARWMVNAYAGWGLLLFAAVLMFMLRHNIGALARGTITHIRYMARLLKQPVRLIVHLVVVALIVIAVIAIPVPNHVSGDVVVRPIQQFSLAVNNYGLVERVLERGGEEPDREVSVMQLTSTEMAVLNLIPTVNDGQRVNVRDTLAMLTSNQIIQEIQQAEAEKRRLESSLELLRASPKQEEVEEAQARVDAARESYEKLNSDYVRAQELADKGLISSEELETARSAMLVARAEWRSRQSALELLKSPPKPEEESVLLNEIRKQEAGLEFFESQLEAQVVLAPFSGIVSRNANDKHMLTVMKSDSVEVRVPVSDYDVTRLKLDQSVAIKVRSFPQHVFYGKVVRIPEAATMVNDRLVFEVSVVLDNPNRVLRDGMTGYAKIDIGNSSIVKLLYRKFLSKIRVEFWSWW